MTFFFFNDTATTEIYTLSLHDALPISRGRCRGGSCAVRSPAGPERRSRDRKSTRLNSSHGYISYAVFCLKKKNNPFISGASAPSEPKANERGTHAFVPVTTPVLAVICM